MKMNYVGRRIYYNPLNGSVIHDTGDRSGIDIVKSSAKEDFQHVLELKDYAMSDLEYIELEFGEYKDDFDNCLFFRVNPETLILEFTYRENNNNSKSLIEQLEELKSENLIMAEMIAALQAEQLQLRAEIENLQLNNPT